MSPFLSISRQKILNSLVGIVRFESFVKLSEPIRVPSPVVNVCCFKSRPRFDEAAAKLFYKLEEGVHVALITVRFRSQCMNVYGLAYLGESRWFSWSQ